MIRNYSFLAFRHFLRNPLQFWINIAGLSSGLCFGLLISLWVVDEYEIDRFHSNKDRIYKVITKQSSEDGDKYYDVTPEIISETIENNLSGVEASISTSRIQNHVIVSEGTVVKERGIFADPDFLSIFDFPLEEGSEKSALSNPKSIVISKNLAQKLFQDSNAIGRVLLFKDYGAVELTVTGVLADLPHQSTMQFDFIVPFDQYMVKRGTSYPWGQFRDQNYVLLKEEMTLTNAQSQLDRIIDGTTSQSGITFKLLPFKNIYLNGIDPSNTDSRLRIVHIFTWIGILIVVIACINFINLSTSSAIRRSKEVGIRKTIGAIRNQLIIQFLIETILVVIFSALVALIMAYLLLPLFNEVSQKDITLPFSSLYFWLIFTAVTIFTSIIAGIFPAIKLSSYNPSQVIKGVQSKGKSFGSLRKFLVITQFTVSLIFIASTIVIYQQINFILEKDLGLNKNNILFHSSEGLTTSQEAYKNDLQTSVEQLKSVSFSAYSPLNISLRTTGVTWSNKFPDDQTYFNLIWTDKSLLATFEIELLDGQNFHGDFDETNESYIINQTAKVTMGLDDPIGERISVDGKKGKIIGLISDFNHDDLFSAIEPVILIYKPQYSSMVFIKLDDQGSTSKQIEATQEIFNKHFSEQPFDYHFVDESYKNSYDDTIRLGILVKVFSLLIILISCLGLFGLASFSSERRKKETGIRKTLGASFSQLLLLLSKDMFLIIVLAFLISLPISWYIIDSWLENFTYKIDLNLYHFLISAGIILFIALLTISYHTVKTAFTNPVDVLKSE